MQQWTDERIMAEIIRNLVVTYDYQLLAPTSALDLMRQMRDEMQAEIDTLTNNCAALQGLADAANDIDRLRVSQVMAQRQKYDALLAWAKRAYELMDLHMEDGEWRLDVPAEVRHE